jgi:hypothetical protein
LTFPDTGVRANRPVRGGESAAEGRRRDIVEGLGQCDEIGVGRVNDDVLGERAVVGESRLSLIGAHLRLPVGAVPADSTPTHEGDGDPPPELHRPHTDAEFDHHTGDFVAGHVR